MMVQKVEQFHGHQPQQERFIVSVLIRMGGSEQLGFNYRLFLVLYKMHILVIVYKKPLLDMRSNRTLFSLQDLSFNYLLE